MIYAKLVSDKRTQDKRTKRVKEQREKESKDKRKEYHASAFIAFARFSHFGNVKTTFSKSTFFNFIIYKFYKVVINR